MANEGTSGGTGLDRRMDELLTCSICISTFVDPFVTPCGHSFCYTCIHQHLAAGERREGGGAIRLPGGRGADASGADAHVEKARGENMEEGMRNDGGENVVAGTGAVSESQICPRCGQPSSTCPQCSAPLRRDQLNPSFVLKGVVKCVSQARQLGSAEQGPYTSLKHMLGVNKEYLSSKELGQLGLQVQEYKRDAEQKEKAGTMNLLLHFLHQSKEEKAKRLEALQKEIECLDADITACNEVGALVGTGAGGDVGVREGEEQGEREREEVGVEGACEVGRCGCEGGSEHRQVAMETSGRVVDVAGKSGDDIRKASAVDAVKCANAENTGNVGHVEEATARGTSGVDLLCSNKRRRIASQFEDLQSVYLQLRSAGANGGEEGDVPGTAHVGDGVGRHDAVGPGERSMAYENAGTAGTSSTGLQKFSKILGTLAHSNRLRILAEIPRPPLRNQSSIISSVEYDRTGNFFATAGVSKRISVFDHTSTMANANHGLPIANCPIVEMVTRSKLSCLSWNKFINSELASSDYEGVLNVWDTATGNLVHEYEAHSKRIWSVDYCCADPKLLVTGSDDSFVKVWSTRSPSAIAQCDVKANVCAVKWHPTQPHTVAIGAADHQVYIFDMRKYDTCMASFRGHQKAVSYVRWAGDNDIVSASTDCTLRLWNVQRAAMSDGKCTQEERVYRGHVNERNFVGLAVSNDLIVCGSETHEVYTYYKPLSKPITKIALPMAGGVGVGARAQLRDRPFVSAVAWHPTKTELLSATSQGSLFVLRLQGDLDGDDDELKE